MNVNSKMLARLAGILFFLLSACTPSFPAVTQLPPTAFPVEEARLQTEPSTTASQSPQQFVIFDDDGSPDGTTALLYFIANPNSYVKSASISFGESYPEIYIQHIGRILDDFGIHDIALGAGQAGPLAGTNAFPEYSRQAANDFWGFPLPNAEKTYDVSDAAKLIVSILSQSEEPVTVFVSGPATNLAQALRLDPTIKDNISAVFIMGGAVYVRGNIDDLVADSGNVTAEWNIYGDPLAAKEVFESGLNIFLVPLDATNQVLISREDTQIWQQGKRIPDFAAYIYDTLMSFRGNNEFMIWDLMTAVLAINPELCVFQPLHLEVVTEDGVTSGQTLVSPDVDPNVNVCLQPDISGIKQMLRDVFSQH
jgi:purine nucleosidase/pyrimidine-specific ribonucleoside hydrolase